MLLHLIFDWLALASGLLISLWFRRKYKLKQPLGISEQPQHHYYLLSLLIGLVVGSTLFGTLNIYIAAQSGIAKSMLGGIFGAIIAAEIFKYFSKIHQSTGLYFIPSLIMLIVVGRIGCFLAGLTDFTYGVETSLAWGVDFGDAVLRHPVQLYESITMLIFLIAMLITYPKHSHFWQQQGFYIFVLVYAGQRFIWEFLKPYPPILLTLNLFHILCLLLLIYSVWMLRRNYVK